MAFAALIMPLVFIIYEDFSFRAIHWFWIALLLIITLWLMPWKVNYWLVNIFLVLFQMLCLTLYFSFRQGKIINIVDQYLGIGDVLFFLPLCILFSPGNFICFFIFSLMLSLSGHLVSYTLKLQETSTIPLAGYMSLALIAVLLGNIAFGFNLQDDYWIKKILSRIQYL